MKQGYEIIAEVQDAYRGLPVRLADLTNKSATYYRNQGQPPRSENPANCGVNSPVADIITYCNLNEAGMPGAGAMMITRIHNELMDAYALNNLVAKSEADLHVNIIDQASDVDRWLARFDLDKATAGELRSFEDECDEAIEAIYAAKSRSRVTRLGMRLVASKNGARK